MSSTQKLQSHSENIADAYPELLKTYITAWNSRSAACSDFIVTVSRQFNDMLRNELKESPPEDFDFLQRVNELNNKIKLVLSSGDPLEVHYKKIVLQLNLEDEETLLKMRLREVKRIDKFDTRSWMHRPKRKSRK